jgi:glycosyltransferase 2 family protein
VPKGEGTIRRPGATWIGAAISLVSLAAVGWWVARQDAPHLPDSGSGFAWLALALAVIAGNFCLRALRWHLILNGVGIAHRRRDVLGLLLVGYMGNTVLPARGGELLKIALLKARTQAGLRELFGTVLVERVLDAATLVVLLVLLVVSGVDAAPGALGTAGIGAGLLLAGGLALLAYGYLRRSGRRARFAEGIRPVLDVLRMLGRREAIPPAALSFVIWCVDGVTLFLLARSLGVELDMAGALTVIVLGALAAAIPAAPGYAGTFDAAMLVGLHAAGVAGADAVSVLLLARFMFFVPVTIAGLIVLLVGYRGIRRPRLADEPLTTAAG